MISFELYLFDTFGDFHLAILFCHLKPFYEVEENLFALQQSGQTKIIKATNLQTLSGNHWTELCVKLHSDSGVFQFLFSKLLFATEEDFTTEDRTALWSAWEKMLILSGKQREFKQKHFHILWFTRGVMQSLNAKISKEDRVSIRNSIEPILSKGRGYFSARIYFGRKNELIKKYEVWIKTRFPKKFSPKKYVGVGYDDKGTARNVASDGNPHWIEVASDKTMNPDEDYTTIVGESIWEQIRAHILQTWNEKPETTRKRNEFLSWRLRKSQLKLRKESW